MRLTQRALVQVEQRIADLSKPAVQPSSPQNLTAVDDDAQSRVLPRLTRIADGHHLHVGRRTRHPANTPACTYCSTCPTFCCGPTVLCRAVRHRSGVHRAASRVRRV
jgi:hypothetical protein